MKVDKSEKNLLVVTSAGFLGVFVFLFGIAVCLLMVVLFNDFNARIEFGCFAVLLGFISLLSAYKSRFEFDGKKKKITIKKGALILTERDQIDFSQVKEVKLEKRSFKGTDLGRLILVLEDSEIPLSPTYKRQISQLKKEADQILRFIKCETPMTMSNSELSFATRATSSLPSGSFDIENLDPKIVDLIKKKRLIEAIKMVRAQSGLGLKESKDLVEMLQKKYKD